MDPPYTLDTTGRSMNTSSSSRYTVAFSEISGFILFPTLVNTLVSYTIKEPKLERPEPLNADNVCSAYKSPPVGYNLVCRTGRVVPSNTMSSGIA